MSIIDSAISAPRQPLRVGRALATLLMLVPFLVGWCAGAAVTACSWTYAAIIVGYRTGRGQEGRGAPSRRDHEDAVHPPTRGSFSLPVARGTGGRS